MRRLSKLDEPEVLQVNGKRWTVEYIAAASDPSVSTPTRWRHSEIRDVLRSETSRKCAYCEAMVEDVSYANVEHILPKAYRPDLVVDWSNLTYVCNRCNVNKHDYYSDELPLVNPYIDGIDDHLVFLGGIVDYRVGDARGQVTVKQLDLNRYDLAYSRVRRLVQLRDMVEQWAAARDPLRAVLATTIKREVEEGEFSRTVLEYLKSLDFPVE